MTADASVRRRHAPASAQRDGRVPAARLHRLVGRRLETDLAHDMLLGGATVVSLVGPAGVGTSTVAAAVVGSLVQQGWAEAATLDLAQMATPAEAVGQVAHAVALARRTPEQRTVVVIEGAGIHRPWALAIVEWACSRSGIGLLLTSLAPLRLPREHIVAVHPWRTTPDDDPATSPGVELFLHRAKRCDPDFRAGPEELRVITRIVHQVGGLPQAVELVASRVTTLPVAAIETQLHRHNAPGPQAVGRHVATPRQRSIRAALDWASAPLNPPTRRALWASALFSRDFTLDAAAAAADFEISEMAGHVSVLLDLGLLVSRQEEGGPVRLRLPRLVWTHARERLTGDPVLQHAATDRLIEHVAALASASAATAGDRATTLAADESLLVMHSDLGQLLDWTVEQRPTRAARLISDLVPLALRHGDEWGLGQRLVDLLGTQVNAPESHPEVLLRAAHLSLRSSLADERAIGWLSEGVEKARAGDDSRLLLWGLALWMDALSSTGDLDRTAAAVAEGLELSRQLGYATWEARFEGWTAMVHHRRHEHDLAFEHGVRALANGRRLKDLRAVLTAGMALRATPSPGREVPGELPRLRELWGLVGQLSDVRDSTGTKVALAMTALSAGDLGEAADCLERQTKTIVRTGLWDLLAYSVFAGVMISTHRDEWRTTARWHGALAPAFATRLSALPVSATSWYETAVERVRAGHDTADWDLHVREGAAVPWSEVANELLDLAGRIQREVRDTPEMT